MIDSNKIKISKVGEALAIAHAFQRLDPNLVIPDKIPPLNGEISSQASKALSQACLATAHPLSLELAAGIISGKITQFVPPDPVMKPKRKPKAKKRKPKVKAKAKKARKRR